MLYCDVDRFVLCVCMCVLQSVTVTSEWCHTHSVITPCYSVESGPVPCMYPAHTTTVCTLLWSHILYIAPDIYCIVLQRTLLYHSLL